MTLKTTLRSILFQGEKYVQHARFAFLPVPENGWPVLLGISFPKSGTHLLDQILIGFSSVAPFSRRLHSFYAEYEGESGHKRAPEDAVQWLDSLRPGDIASAHLFSRSEVVARVSTPAFVPFFIYRDPRDVAVSHVHYVTEMEPNHVHHPYYCSLPDFNARLTTSILGRPDAGVEFPNIAERFAPYLDWLEQPSVLKIQFEGLIHDRVATLNRIIEHLLASVSLDVNPIRLLKYLESAIKPKKSPTFRSGKTGEWKNCFSKEHKRLFKEVAGDLLIRLGYESNDDW